MHMGLHCVFTYPAAVVIGFRSPEYEVSEVTGYIVLSVEVLQGNIDQGEAVWVIFYTEDGTALGKQLPNIIGSTISL